MKWLSWAALALALVVPAWGRIASSSTAAPREPEPADVAEGKKLFTRAWSANDPLCAGGDGLGPVFNARSCVACHFQGGVGGGGDLRSNVFTFLVLEPGNRVRGGMVHRYATAAGFQERFSNVHPDLPAQTIDEHGFSTASASLAGVAAAQVSMRNTPALFGAKWIDALPDHVILAQQRRQQLRHGFTPHDQTTRPVGRAVVTADGRVGKFGWRGQTPSLLDFVQGACANEMGLSNPGSPQPEPLTRTSYRGRGLDLTQQQCEQMRDFLAALPRPGQRVRPHEEPTIREGEAHFARIGCAECHTPNVGSVEGIYSDLLLHRMGADLAGGGHYYASTLELAQVSSSGPLPDEWRTPPLWGVADSAPYLHDGRARTLEDAIKLHGGQAAASAQAFESLPPAERAQLVAFLKSLRAPQ